MNLPLAPPARRSKSRWQLNWWIAWLVLLLSLLLSLVVSPLPRRSLIAAVPVLPGFLLYTCLSLWRGATRWLRWVWWMLILSGAGVALLTAISGWPAEHPVFLWLRAAGVPPSLLDAANANVLSGALALLLPLGLAASVEGCRRSNTRPGVLRFLAPILTISMLGPLIIAGSRGGYLAGCVGLGVFCWLCWPRLARLVIPLLIAAGAVGGTWYGWRNVIDALLRGSATSGLDQRIEIWSRAVTIICDFPFTGVGLSCFEPVVARMYPLFLVAAGTVPHAHNLLLQVAVDVGLPGLAAYTALLGMAIGQAAASFRTLTAQKSADLAILSAGCLAAMAAMLAHGLIDAVTWGNNGASLPWIVWGLAMALGNMTGRTPPAS